MLFIFQLHLAFKLIIQFIFDFLRFYHLLILLIQLDLSIWYLNLSSFPNIFLPIIKVKSPIYHLILLFFFLIFPLFYFFPFHELIQQFLINLHISKVFKLKFLNFQFLYHFLINLIINLKFFNDNLHLLLLNLQFAIPSYFKDPFKLRFKIFLSYSIITKILKLDKFINTSIFFTNNYS